MNMYNSTKTNLKCIASKTPARFQDIIEIDGEKAVVLSVVDAPIDHLPESLCLLSKDLSREQFAAQMRSQNLTTIYFIVAR